MATTGFWPVKSRLKEVIDYAENPDKTIDKRYVDSDLYAALQYVSNDKKTDECMYVSGINCNEKRAYERMTACLLYTSSSILQSVLCRGASHAESTLSTYLRLKLRLFPQDKQAIP